MSIVNEVSKQLVNIVDSLYALIQGKINSGRVGLVFVVLFLCSCNCFLKILYFFCAQSVSWILQTGEETLQHIVQQQTAVHTLAAATKNLHDYKHFFTLAQVSNNGFRYVLVSNLGTHFEDDIHMIFQAGDWKVSCIYIHEPNRSVPIYAVNCELIFKLRFHEIIQFDSAEFQ